MSPMNTRRPIIPPANEPRKRKNFFRGLGKIALGLVALYGSAHLFAEFTRLETDGGKLRLNIFAVLLYNVGGKWLSCGLILVGGAYFIYEGYMQAAHPGRKSP